MKGRELKKAFFVVASVLMLLLTVGGFLPERGSFFVNGSYGYMLDLSPLSYWSIVLVPVFAACGYLALKTGSRWVLLLSFAVLFSWFLSGRTVGVLMFPEVRVYTGWFGIKAQELILCSGHEGEDCETLIAYRTKVEPGGTWRVRIRNRYHEATVFLGPFGQNAMELLQAEIGNGKYYRR